MPITYLDKPAYAQPVGTVIKVTTKEVTVHYSLIKEEVDGDTAPWTMNVKTLENQYVEVRRLSNDLVDVLMTNIYESVRVFSPATGEGRDHGTEAHLNYLKGIVQFTPKNAVEALLRDHLDRAVDALSELWGASVSTEKNSPPRQVPRLNATHVKSIITRHLLENRAR